MKQNELTLKIKFILETLSQKRSVLIREFRKKLEEKSIVYIKNKLNQE